MFESIVWFIFKDSRINLPLIKRNSTIFLIIYAIINIGLSVVLIINQEALSELPQNLYDLMITKMYIEITQSVLFMPFLIYKSYLKYNFDDKKPEEKYRIDLYLKSRTLERALGVTLPGLFMLLFGFFNIIWAFFYINQIFFMKNSSEKNILMVFVIVDIVAFGITLLFAFVVLFFKLKGAYKCFLDNKRVLKRKIVLE